MLSGSFSGRKPLFFGVTLLLVLLFVFNWYPPTSISQWQHTTPGTLGEFDDEYNNGYKRLPERLRKTFPPPDPTRRKYHEWNALTMAELHACMALDNCGPNQEKVALLAAHWFEEAIVRGWRGGEGVWGMSVHKHMRALGYTTLFANSFVEALEQYRMFPDLVKVVIRNQAGECHANPNCVKGPNNPGGIPAWKIFDFEYFPSHGGHEHASLLKGKWILSSNPDPVQPSPIQYLGFSVEDDCTKQPTIRLSQRKHQVWMLMKQLTYVYDHRFAWNRSYFSLAAKELDMQFNGAWQIDQHYQWDPKEKGVMTDIEDRGKRVMNFGKLGPKEFEDQLGMSKVMIGVGNPWMSPSPFHALCLGIPFVNPVIRWNEADPWDRKHWETQHPSLHHFDPPYVYHVHARNYTAFIDAIRTASKTEIPSFIPQHMTEMAVRERVEYLLEHDWKSDAAALLEERKKEAQAGGKPYLFEL